VECGKLSLEQVDACLQQIADALQHVHDNGPVHCDLKPENILLSADGTLLLADFGVTRSIETIQMKSTRAGAGTPTYMAPEQFDGKPHPASDQYALGIMVYECLSGKPPFEGRPTTLMNRHLSSASFVQCLTAFLR
jgi:eukaryotic-like serine/threonine-protein kinase